MLDWLLLCFVYQFSSDNGGSHLCNTMYVDATHIAWACDNMDYIFQFSFTKNAVSLVEMSYVNVYFIAADSQLQ